MDNKSDSLMIEDVKYVREDSITRKVKGNIKIVFLQRGNVVVGYFSKEGYQCKLENAAVIRLWGTTRGIGEIAFEGPTINTKLDKCPTINFNELTSIMIIDCEESKWKKYL
jgi:hypothetical protein